MLLMCCLLHIRVIIPRHFIFSMFVSWSRSRWIYIVDFHFHFHYTLVNLIMFQNMSYYFWMITWMKKANNFELVNSLLLDFFANFSLVLLMKVLLIKKFCISFSRNHMLKFIQELRYSLIFCSLIFLRVVIFLLTL